MPGGLRAARPTKRGKGQREGQCPSPAVLFSPQFHNCGIFAQKNAAVQAEPLQSIPFSSSQDPASHRYTVGSSADISAASVSLTGILFVPLLYQILPAIHEETLNVPKRNYVQKENTAGGGVCLCLLSRIQVADQQNEGQDQGENADRPGIQGLPGGEHQHQAGSRHCQRTCHRQLPADRHGELTIGQQI